MRSVIFFLHSCTFFINCKRDRFLRIVLYSGKLHLLIFEKFPFEKNDTNYATCEYPSENQALKICVICWYQIVIITELCDKTFVVLKVSYKKEAFWFNHIKQIRLKRFSLWNSKMWDKRISSLRTICSVNWFNSPSSRVFCYLISHIKIFLHYIPFNATSFTYMNCNETK